MNSFAFPPFNLVCRLSREDSLLKVFLRKLPPVSLDRSGLLLLPSTRVNGQSFVIGVSSCGLIHSVPNIGSALLLIDQFDYNF